MSGTFPTAGFTTINYRNNVTNRTTESVNGRTQRSTTGGQYWSFSLESPPLERTAFMAIYSFIVKQNGTFEEFTISPPVVGSTSGTATGDLTTNSMSTAQKQIGSSTLRFGNRADSSPVTGTLKAGDLFKLSSHDKVYMITADVTFDGSTAPEVSIYPPLVQAVDNAQDVTYNSVPVKVHFQSDQQSYSVDQNLLYTYQIEVREVL